MELSSTWSPSWAHPAESWLAQGPEAALYTRGILLTANQSGKSISGLVPLRPSSWSERRSHPSWDSMSGTHSQALAVALSLPKKQTHVSRLQTNSLTRVTFSSRERTALLGALPENDGYSFSMRTWQEAPSLTAPTSPLLHSTPSISPSK